MKAIPAGSPETADRLAALSKLLGLPGTELESAVARVCSDYGTVARVVIHYGKAHASTQAFALVDMSEVQGAERLAAAYNRERMGTAVLLLMEPRTAAPDPTAK